MVAHEHTNWHSKYNILSWLQPWGSCPYLQVKQWFVLCGLSPILHSNLIPPSLTACLCYFHAYSTFYERYLIFLGGYVQTWREGLNPALI